MPELPSRRPTRSIDPDVDLHLPAQRHEWTHREVLPTIAIGGMIGATVRYAAGLIWPTAVGTFPWTTLLVNLIGCFAIGALMVIVIETERAHPLVRPFLGVGVLGGFTTFSTDTSETRGLLGDHQPLMALGYLVLTPLLAVLAVTGAVLLTRGAVSSYRARRAA